MSDAEKDTKSGESNEPQQADAPGDEAPREEAAEAESTEQPAEELVVPSDLVAKDEESIREELGIGVGSEEERSDIESLLRDATVGYEQVFSGTALDPRGAREPSAPEGAAEASLEGNLDLLRDVNMKVKVELGRGQMRLKDILRLGQGSVVELEKLAGDPLDIYVNDKVVARGEVLVLNENFCVRLTEIFNPKEILAQKS